MHSPSNPSEPWVQEMLARYEDEFPDGDMAAALSAFSIPELLSSASKVVGKQCIEAVPLSGGGFNTVFLLKFDDASSLIARLGGSRFGTQGLSEHDLSVRFLSEIATMAYVRKNTLIPVPKLHYYDADPHNAVGARYMIMDVVPGPRLSFVWDDLPPESRRSLVSQIGQLEKQLLDTRFPAIGSLVDEHGALGELCCRYGNPNPLLPEHRGPLSSSRDYLLAHAHSSLQAYTDRAVAGVDVAFCNYAIRWLGLAIEGISALTLTDEDERFALFYNEFHMTHIHVSPAVPTQIIGMLDWEGSTVGPLWDWTLHCGFDNVLFNDAILGRMENEEFEDLKELRRSISMGGAGDQDARPWDSPLDLYYLLRALKVSDATAYDKEAFDGKFADWYERMKDAEGLEGNEGFRKLHDYILSSPELQ